MTSSGRGRVVLVTGVSSDLGGRCARSLLEDPAVRRVVGVDVVPARSDLGDVDFVRADIRHPVIAKLIADHAVDTVVHMSLQGQADRDGVRSAVNEHNVIGTMQLLAACQQTPGVARLVAMSSADVYGASGRDPALFSEDMTARGMRSSGFGRNVVEVEGYVRGFSRRRPDITVTMLRPAGIIGPRVDSPLTTYFRMPVVPTPLGFDARLQLLHEDDLVASVRHAVAAGVPGTFNLAGEGILTLSQALRRLRRPAVALPAFALDILGSVPGPLRASGLDRDLLGYLTFGRGLDLARMREVLGFTPEHTTEGAFGDFACSLRPGSVPTGHAAPHPVSVARDAGGERA